MSRKQKLLLTAAVIWSASTLFIIAVILLLTGVELPDLTESSLSVSDISSPGAVVKVIDVGQGSSLLIQLSDETVTNILIDAGDTFAGDELCRSLRSSKVKSIDLLIITHPHTDHFGGALKLFEKFPVDEIWMPTVPEKLEPTSSTYFKFLEAIEKIECPVFLKSKPESIRFSDSASLSLLDGFVDDPDDLNDCSLCIRFDYKDASFLVTGDGEAALEEKLIKSRFDVDADVFIAGHHGSNSSNTIEFLNAVSPKVSAVSVGKDNEYALPSKKVIDRLAKFGNVYRTDINRDISFLTDGETITVSSNDITEHINSGR